MLRFPVPHVGPDVEDLRPRRRDEHHGCAHVGDEPLEKVEQIRLGPVDVLDDEDDRTAGGELLDERHGGGVEALASVERVKLGSDVEPEREREDLAPFEPRDDLVRRSSFA